MHSAEVEMNKTKPSARAATEGSFAIEMLHASVCMHIVLLVDSVAYALCVSPNGFVATSCEGHVYT